MSSLLLVSVVRGKRAMVLRREGADPPSLVWDLYARDPELPQPVPSAGCVPGRAGERGTAAVLGRARLDKLTSWQVEEMFARIEEQNAHILECRESEDAKVRASVRGRRVVSLSTKYRIRATLRSALSEAIRRPDLPVSVNIASHARLPSCPGRSRWCGVPSRCASGRWTGRCRGR